MGSAASTKVCNFENNEKINNNIAKSPTQNSAGDTLQNQPPIGVLCKTKNGENTENDGKDNVLVLFKSENCKENKNGDLLDKIQKLELDLAKAQSQNMDWEDQIQTLKEQLANDDQNELDVPEADQISNNMKVVDLEKQIELLNSELLKLNTKFKRRVKTLKSQLSEAKQTSQIQRMEMTDEINQLMEENQKLTDSQTNKTSSVSENIPDSNACQRTTLVLELSSQVSEQCQIIRDLEESLVEKQNEIDNLKSQLTVAESKQNHVSGEDCWASPVNSQMPIAVNNVSSFTKSSSKPPRKKQYKIGQHRDNHPNKQSSHGIINSDSDSDWTNEVIVSKIHSAPVGIRAQPTF
ncbi:myosin-J heavy chain [Patella vulgata]|uniref:myosin-J heavy chain n=1 Tax=Patella vulgata TaxID=6465 RepID=UPI0024A7AAF8|nr:myosin-J heavy chain [Patella vulgata]